LTRPANARISISVRFAKRGVFRRTVSFFSLIGSIRSSKISRSCGSLGSLNITHPVELRARIDSCRFAPQKAERDRPGLEDHDPRSPHRKLPSRPRREEMRFTRMLRFVGCDVHKRTAVFTILL